jgi:hypothetical protein
MAYSSVLPTSVILSILFLFLLPAWTMLLLMDRFIIRLNATEKHDAVN